MLYGIVAVIGPPAGGWIVQNYGYKAMLWAAAILYIIAMVIRILMARSGRHDTVTYERSAFTFDGLKKNLGTMFGMLFAGGVITWILITDGVRDISFGMSMNFLGLFMEQIGGLNIQTIGLLNGVFGLFMMAFMIPGGWLADKKGERLGIALGFFMHFLSLGAISILPPASPVWMYFCGFAVAGLGVGLIAPAYQSLIAKPSPPACAAPPSGSSAPAWGSSLCPRPTSAACYGRTSPRSSPSPSLLLSACSPSSRCGSSSNSRKTSTLWNQTGRPYRRLHKGLIRVLCVFA